jgi:hypothetical protein
MGSAGAHSSREFVLLFLQGAQQAVERVGELLDAFALERFGEVVVVDAGAREVVQKLAGLRQVVFEPRRGLPVIVPSGIVLTVSGPASWST